MSILKQYYNKIAIRDGGMTPVCTYRNLLLNNITSKSQLPVFFSQILS